MSTSFKDSILLGYDAVSQGHKILRFWRNTLLSSSRIDRS